MLDYADSPARYDGLAEFYIASLHVCGITGTCVDAPIHPGAGIPVCEHMTDLHALGDGGGLLHAVPIAWVGGASFPVRAYVVRD